MLLLQYCSLGISILLFVLRQYFLKVQHLSITYFIIRPKRTGNLHHGDGLRNPQRKTVSCNMTNLSIHINLQCIRAHSLLRIRCAIHYNKSIFVRHFYSLILLERYTVENHCNMTRLADYYPL